MPTYDLRLYGQLTHRSRQERRRGEYQFDAPNDRAAIQTVETRYAGQLAEHAYALLVDDTHRFVWERGSSIDTLGT
jgi:hypothetical protein